jgi:large subunit ribosomal protein L9
MDIILLERVGKLGHIGDVVKVKNGYARNFLLPQNKALRATKANLSVFEKQRKEIEANNLKAKTEAEKVAAKMTNITATIIRQAGESGQLFGSVSARDINLSLDEQGYKVDKSQIILDRAIKTLGLVDLMVRLHPEVEIKITVNIARSLGEAEIQAKGGNVDSRSGDDLEFSVEDYFEKEEDAVAAVTGDKDKEETVSEDEKSE